MKSRNERLLRKVVIREKKPIEKTQNFRCFFFGIENNIGKLVDLYR